MQPLLSRVAATAHTRAASSSSPDEEACCTALLPLHRPTQARQRRQLHELKLQREREKRGRRHLVLEEADGLRTGLVAEEDDEGEEGEGGEKGEKGEKGEEGEKGEGGKGGRGRKVGKAGGGSAAALADLEYALLRPLSVVAGSARELSTQDVALLQALLCVG